MPEATEILRRMSAGDQTAAGDLLGLVYDELRRMAAGYLVHERAGHTLQPTALVHEAYLKMIGGPGRRDDEGAGSQEGAAGSASGSSAWQGRAHFLAVAATAMRRVLVEHARRRQAAKRGGAVQGGAGKRARVELDPGVLHEDGCVEQVLELEELLDRLSALDERKCRVVELRFYAGMTNEEIAEALQVARSTVSEDWAVARAWLAARLGEEAGGPGS